jgi:hypothetical protein
MKKSLSSFIDRVKVKDVLASPPSSTDSDLLLQLREINPPKNNQSLSHFLYNITFDPIAEESNKTQTKNDEESESASEEEEDNSSDDENSSVEGNFSSESENFDSESMKDAYNSTGSPMKGRRRGNESLKQEALSTPIIHVANAMALPCGKNCCFNRSCTQKLLLDEVIDERISIFGPLDKPAPRDKDKGAKIMQILKSKFVKDPTGKHYFNIGTRRLCPAAYVRVSGLGTSSELSKAPGQFLRLMNAHIDGVDELVALAEEKTKLDTADKFTPIRGFQEGFITDIGKYFSDYLPTVKSASANATTSQKQLPYRYIMDLYEEMKFQCATANPPVPESVYGSYPTFKKTYLKMYRKNLVQLMGGKSGFETCAFCNHCVAIKRSAAAKHDRSTIDIMRALQRLHMKQEGLERQHCENFIYEAKTMYNGFGN